MRLLTTVFVLGVIAAEPVAPAGTIKLFNGKDLSGLTPWLKDSKRDDPKKVFRVEGGEIRMSGGGFGYLATDKEYRDYRLVVEYKWGDKTDGGKFVRNSGVLLHATGPDGGANGTWMSAVECQLAQGCVGDLIVIRGNDADDKPIPVEIAADVDRPEGKRPRWKAGGAKRIFTGGQLWWSKHDLDFQELIDTRGKDDVESKLGEWTKVEVVCAGDRIAVSVNGTRVNECYDAKPKAGKILLQCEGFEVAFRNFEIHPLAGEKR